MTSSTSAAATTSSSSEANPFRPAPLTTPILSPFGSKSRARELEIRKMFEDTTTYSHANTPSSVSNQAVEGFKSEFQFSGEHSLRAPSPNEKMYWRPTSPPSSANVDV